MQKKFLDDTERDEFLERLKQVPENNSCFDCAKKAPKWSSASFGILLCLDCSGKHRELGPQISFVRSLTLDAWTQKEALSIELSGNKVVADYFKKYGLSKPYDYKSPNAQKYKQELIKKIDAYMAAASGQKTDTTTNAVVNQAQSKPEENKNSFFETPTTTDAKLTKSVSEPENTTTAPVIDKNSTKAKNFSVEFTSKGGNTGKKGIQAKKITNFDLEGLSLEESDEKGAEKKSDGMGEFNMGFGAKTNESTSTTSNSYETKSTSYSGYGSTSNGKSSTEDAQEKFQKFGNAKSISSDAFNGTKNEDSSFNANKYSGQRAISSAQVFGYEEDEPQNSNATVDKLKNVASNLGEKAVDWGGKLKEKAGSWMNKFKSSEWSG